MISTLHWFHAVGSLGYYIIRIDMTYEPTANEDIVNEVTIESIDLSVLIQTYLKLRTAWLNREQPKTVPDQDTLALWNMEVENRNAGLEGQINELYYSIKPIHDAGLLPSKYEDEYQQLETLVLGWQ